MIKRLKEQWRLDNDEKKAFAIVAVVFALILSYDQWGADAFNLAVGLKNLLAALVIVAASLLAHDAGHRIAAKKFGYHTKFRYWTPGLVACVLLVMVTNGELKLFVGGSVVFTHLALRRLSKTGYKESLRDYVLMGLAGPVASLLFAAVIRVLASLVSLNALYIDQLIYFNLIYAALSLLPFPPLDGGKILLFGRGIYVFVGASVLSYVLIGLLGYYSMLLALMFGIAATLVYFLTYQNNGGKIKI